MLKRGEVNNCLNCKSSYGQYDNNPASDWGEFWCEVSVFSGKELKKPKGLCQFCNPKSRYFNK